MTYTQMAQAVRVSVVLCVAPSSQYRTSKLRGPVNWSLPLAAAAVAVVVDVVVASVVVVVATAVELSMQAWLLGLTSPN